jgi:plasmid stability protein
MKTTLDLPDALLRQVKLRALHEGRKLKDEVADLLRKGLAVVDERPRDEPKIVKDKRTGLPVILGKRPAGQDLGKDLTPDRVAEILLEQEAGWADDASR